MTDLLTLSGLIAQEHLALKQAQGDGCLRWHAGRLIDLRHKRGDYAGILQVMTPETRALMVDALVKSVKEKL